MENWYLLHDPNSVDNMEEESYYYIGRPSGTSIFDMREYLAQSGVHSATTDVTYTYLPQSTQGGAFDSDITAELAGPSSMNFADSFRTPAIQSNRRAADGFLERQTAHNSQQVTCSSITSCAQRDPSSDRRLSAVKHVTARRDQPHDATPATIEVRVLRSTKLYVNSSS
jgi:hypothetical protein